MVKDVHPSIRCCLECKQLSCPGECSKIRTTEHKHGKPPRLFLFHGYWGSLKEHVARFGVSKNVVYDYNARVLGGNGST